MLRVEQILMSRVNYPIATQPVSLKSNRGDQESKRKWVVTPTVFRYPFSSMHRASRGLAKAPVLASTINSEEALKQRYLKLCSPGPMRPLRLLLPPLKDAGSLAVSGHQCYQYTDLLSKSGLRRSQATMVQASGLLCERGSDCITYFMLRFGQRLLDPLQQAVILSKLAVLNQGALDEIGVTMSEKTYHNITHTSQAMTDSPRLLAAFFQASSHHFVSQEKAAAMVLIRTIMAFHDIVQGHRTRGMNERLSSIKCISALKLLCCSEDEERGLAALVEYVLVTGTTLVGEFGSMTSMQTHLAKIQTRLLAEQKGAYLATLMAMAASQVDVYRASLKPLQRAAYHFYHALDGAPFTDLDGYTNLQKGAAWLLLAQSTKMQGEFNGPLGVLLMAGNCDHAKLQSLGAREKSLVQLVTDDFGVGFHRQLSAGEMFSSAFSPKVVDQGTWSPVRSMIRGISVDLDDAMQRRLESFLFVISRSSIQFCCVKTPCGYVSKIVRAMSMDASIELAMADKYVSKYIQQIEPPKDTLRLPRLVPMGMH